MTLFEVTLTDNHSGFPIVAETLTRIGVVTKKYLPQEKKVSQWLHQICHLICVDSRHYLVHYKDIVGKEMTPKDYARLNTIAFLLARWNMISIVHNDIVAQYGTVLSIFVLPFAEKEKKEVECISKVTVEQLKAYIKKVQDESK